MRTFRFKSYAKINLSIDVTCRRADGYHDLKSIMQSVSLYDVITLKVGEPGIKVTNSLPFLPCDSRNIAYKAAMYFYDEAGILPELSIDIQKNIPVGAGLGGGSSNAATVLLALNKIYSYPLSFDCLLKIGKNCGADVPFCMMGGTCLAEGIGDVLTPLPSMPDCGILLVKPSFSISTKAIFEALDLKNNSTHPDTAGIIKAIEKGNLFEICVRLFNTLESVTEKMHPDISHIKSLLLDTGAAGTIMSGSGPTVLGIFKTEQEAKRAISAFSGMPVSIFAVKPVFKIL